MKLLKNALSAAVATAAISGLVASSAMAATPSAYIAAPGDPYVSPNGLGQALIYPYYTVNDGSTTSFNVFNTSTTHAVAVKVRIREYKNSRDVLDFTLVLSPNDKWYGNLLPDGEGAKLHTADKSCTVPVGVAQGSGTALKSDAYALEQYADASPADGLSRLREGYVEVIPMAWSDVEGNSVFAGALHSQETGIPGDCKDVEDAFEKTVFWDTLNQPTDIGDGAPSIAADDDWVAIPDGSNPLFGELIIKNEDGGVAGGTNAVALADWMEGEDLLVSQAFPYNLEPTLGTAAGHWDTSSIDKTDLALAATTVINEATNIDSNGRTSKTSWAVTFPTKSFHVDQKPYNIHAGSSLFRGPAPSGDVTLATLTDVAPFQNLFDDDTGTADVAYAPTAYDNEEGTADTADIGVEVSPGSFTNPGTDSLKYEANVIEFGGSTLLASQSPEDASTLLDELPQDDSHINTNGFVSMSFYDGNAFIDGETGAFTPQTLITVPVVGFAMKERNAGSADLSFGQMLDHKFRIEGEEMYPGLLLNE